MNPIAAHQPSQTGAPPSDFRCVLHFLLFHHGYHGEGSEFKCWCKIRKLLRQGHVPSDTEAKGSTPSPPGPKYFFIAPCCNDGCKADDGVMVCACRFVKYVCKVVRAIVAKALGIDRKQRCATHAANTDAADGAATARRHKLCFSLVGHSMGGLILRAALPELMGRIEGTHKAPPYDCEVCWNVFCTLSTPHLGVRYLDSRFLTCLGGCIGSHLSKALEDMFLKDKVLTRDLVSDVYLGAWSRFERRVTVSPVNDHTVMTYSSSFMLTLHVLKRVGGTLTKEESKVVKQLSKNKEVRKKYADVSSAYLAHCGITCASSLEELCTNGVVLTEISPRLWPPTVLVEERKLAERILQSVAPLEVHLVDFRAPYTHLTSSGTYRGKGGAGLPHRPGCLEKEMMWRGAYDSCHTALICKNPFFYPQLFGFVPQYVMSCLMGVPLTCSTLVLPPKCSLSCTCEGSCDDEVLVRQPRIHTECC